MYFTHPQFKNFTLRPFARRVSEIELKNKLRQIFPNGHILFTDSGRSAFQIAIQELKLENSEMILPAYICDIFKPILKNYNIKPIYLDINLLTFNLEDSRIEDSITPQTKSILICHTYGLPNEMNKILEIAKKHNLKIIEDCAHIFPIKLSGDCAFFSFAKLFPVVNGGMLISKKPIGVKLPKYKFKLRNIIKFLRLFPVLGKTSEVFRLTREGRRDPKTIREEKSRGIPRGASRVSLRILNYCLDNFARQTEKRIELAKYFQKKLQVMGFKVQDSKNNTFAYLSALAPGEINRDELFNKLRKKGIYCSRIWQRPIILSGPLSELSSDRTIFSNTIKATKTIINLPLQNWHSKKDVNKIIRNLTRILYQHNI